MGWFNRAAGYPDGDLTGRDRALFRKVGSKAAQAFMIEQNPAAASELMERWLTQVARQVGEYHPDVGRGSLLMGIFMAMMGHYDMALQLSQTAIQLLEKLGQNDYDYRAAKNLEDRLAEKIETGTFKGPALLDPETPIGHFFFDLKP